MHYDELLLKSCKSGSLTKVQEAIDNGADVNLVRRGITPLFIACRHGHIEIVDYLLQNKAKINQLTTSNHDDQDILNTFNRAIGLAQYIDLLDNIIGSALLLVDKDHLSDSVLIKQGISPLFIAAYYHHDEIVDLLLKNGAKIGVKTAILLKDHLTIKEMWSQGKKAVCIENGKKKQSYNYNQILTLVEHPELLRLFASCKEPWRSQTVDDKEYNDFFGGLGGDYFWQTCQFLVQGKLSVEEIQDVYRIFSFSRIKNQIMAELQRYIEWFGGNHTKTACSFLEAVSSTRTLGELAKVFLEHQETFKNAPAFSIQDKLKKGFNFFGLNEKQNNNSTPLWQQPRTSYNSKDPYCQLIDKWCENIKHYQPPKERSFNDENVSNLNL
ncbi:ankyrin repeat domain-containing protein [Legionella israelensis]|uniref:Ankyrin repeat domain-containing protein n=1 Tax=Legionella israelensis TaxID=454 RepID=A0AAX1EFA6_9GAMM|nr:ankyrin repeat domain-containing protein [Legionella israelensis]QBR83547.1 ankyrin repeat domain-containing protein [Legionella israelensis]